MYVAVKGGEKAIDAAHALQESRRRGDTDLPELSVAQIEQQLPDKAFTLHPATAAQK